MFNDITHVHSPTKARRTVCLTLGLCTLGLLTQGLIAVADANTPKQEISPIQLPIGKSKAAVLALAEAEYGTLALCDTTRTGFGFNRRAYLLETCTLANEAAIKLCDETPSIATYHFFEDRLVQVQFSFTQLYNQSHFDRCIKQDTKKLVSRNSDENALVQNLSINKDNQVTVSETAIVEKIHSLRQSL